MFQMFLISNDEPEKSTQGNIITETLKCSPDQVKFKRKVEIRDDNTKTFI